MGVRMTVKIMWAVQKWILQGSGIDFFLFGVKTWMIFFFGVFKLSAELRALLERIQKPKTKPVCRKASLKPSPELLSLIGRMEARKWRADQLTCAVEYLRESANEIYLIKHIRACRRCQLEAELTVERYYGRGLPWFLDIMNDVAESWGDPDVEADLRLKDCPRVEDYRIGSYWEDVKCVRAGKPIPAKETLKFIMDRCDWAERVIRQQIFVAARFYKRLKDWDLEPPVPTEASLPFSFSGWNLAGV